VKLDLPSAQELLVGLLNQKKLAKLFGISDSYAQKLMERCDFPPSILLGGLKRWRLRDVYNWLDEMGKKQTPELTVTEVIGDPPLLGGAAEVQLPTVLAEVRDRIKLYVGYPPCVYFLVLRGDVVYVGKTRNIPVRVQQHRNGDQNTTKKEFDSVYFLEVGEGKDLTDVENYFIHKLRPKHNICGVTFPWKDVSPDEDFDELEA